MGILSILAGIAMFMSVCSMNPLVYAQPGENDQVIEEVSSAIDQEARKLGGTKTITDHLKKQFHIDESMIYGLRERKIGYGDINTVLAVAEQMPGGITKENVEEVINMRGGHTGHESWNKITDYLGINIHSIAHRTKAVIFTLPEEEPSLPTTHEQAEDSSGVLIKKF